MPTQPYVPENPPPFQLAFVMEDGNVFLGEVEIPLASPQVHLVRTDAGEITLEFTIRTEHSTAFTEAWQRCVHSSHEHDPQFIRSEVAPVHPWAATDAVPSGYYGHSGVWYVAPGKGQTTYRDPPESSPSTADVSYSPVTYRMGGTTDHAYSDVSYGSMAQPMAVYAMSDKSNVPVPPVNSLRMTLTGKGDGQKRQILNVAGVVYVETKSDSAPQGELRVFVALTPTLPIEQLLWVIEGE
jgi:hypothetical protein